MKHLAIFLVLLCPMASAAGSTDTLTILHINDTHSCLMPLAPRNPDLTGTRGGIARAATLVGTERATRPNTLFLHAGDLSIGDPMYNAMFGVPEYVLLQQLGLDAMAVGNHEFDLTPATLQAALDSAAAMGMQFPLLSANIDLSDPLVAGLRPYILPRVVRQVGPVRVGLFGLVTPETNLLSLPAPAVIDTNLGPIAAAQVTALEAETCDVVILVSHLGHYYDRLIASNVPGIDIIVGGHDHIVLSQPDPVRQPTGDTTWIVQAGAFYEHVGRLTVSVGGGRVSIVDYTALPLDDAVPEEPNTRQAVQALAADVESAFGIPFYSSAIWSADSTLEELSTDLVSRTSVSTPVAELVTKAFWAETRTDIALTVGGATAQNIWAGPVTPADIFRTLGYGFNTDNYLGYRLATFSLTGEDLIKGLEWGLSALELNDEYVVIGHNLSYTYDASQPPFSRLTSVSVGGRPIEPAQEYSITANEFVLIVIRDFLATQLGITVLRDTVLAGSSEFGAVVRHLTTSVVPSEIPVTTELGQNYPNPFNPATVIPFRVASRSHVRLSVYNLLGQQVAVLLDGERPAGVHAVRWDGNAPTGVYLYRIETTDLRTGERWLQTRRMVLLR